MTKLYGKYYAQSPLQLRRQVRGYADHDSISLRGGRSLTSGNPKVPPVWLRYSINFGYVYDHVTKQISHTACRGMFCSGRLAECCGKRSGAARSIILNICIMNVAQSRRVITRSKYESIVHDQPGALALHIAGRRICVRVVRPYAGFCLQLFQDVCYRQGRSDCIPVWHVCQGWIRVLRQGVSRLRINHKRIGRYCLLMDGVDICKGCVPALVDVL